MPSLRPVTVTEPAPNGVAQTNGHDASRDSMDETIAKVVAAAAGQGSSPLLTPPPPPPPPPPPTLPAATDRKASSSSNSKGAVIVNDLCFMSVTLKVEWYLTGVYSL